MLKKQAGKRTREGLAEQGRHPAIQGGARRPRHPTVVTGAGGQTPPSLAPQGMTLGFDLPDPWGPSRTEARMPMESPAAQEKTHLSGRTCHFI